MNIPKWAESLTEEQRRVLFAPSRHLLQLQAFKAEYRRQKPHASMMEVQQAYQLAENAKMRDAS